MEVMPVGERVFPPEPQSARAARRFVRGRVEGLAVDAEVVELLSSELATNAIKHAKTHFAVRVRSIDGALRVEVANHEPELLPVIRPPRDGGHGLVLMQALAARWGLEFSRDEKVIWFELLPVTDSAASDTQRGNVQSSSD
jgi:anti-sigma regulatory factor (Ser/Thr protein kinase)